MSAFDASVQENRTVPTEPVPCTAAPQSCANGELVIISNGSHIGLPIGGEVDMETNRIQCVEQLVDRIGATVSDFTARLGHRIVRLASRTKEEVADIWGEAQTIRRGDE